MSQPPAGVDSAVHAVKVGARLLATVETVSTASFDLMRIVLGWLGLHQFAGPADEIPRPATAGTPSGPSADEVEQAVRALESQEDGWKAAQALRAEYMTPGLANKARRQRLSRVGVQCSRAQYYPLLGMGLIYVAAWLRITFLGDRALG